MMLSLIQLSGYECNYCLSSIHTDLLSDIFGAKAVASDVPPDSPGNGIPCTVQIGAS